MQSLKEQPYTGGCTKRLEMLLTDGSSATEVQAVRFSRICIACISSREVGKKQSIQVQSLPNQNKEEQCITTVLQQYFSANKQCFPLTINQYKHQHKPNFSETNR
jgi:hypothetical protein